MLYFVSNGKKFYSVEYNEEDVDRDFYEGFRYYGLDHHATHYLDSNYNLCYKDNAAYELHTVFYSQSRYIYINCKKISFSEALVEVKAKHLPLEAYDYEYDSDDPKKEIVYAFEVNENGDKFLNFAFELVAYFNFMGGFEKFDDRRGRFDLGYERYY